MKNNLNDCDFYKWLYNVYVSNCVTCTCTCFNTKNIFYLIGIDVALTHSYCDIETRAGWMYEHRKGSREGGRQKEDSDN